VQKNWSHCSSSNHCSILIHCNFQDRDNEYGITSATHCLRSLGDAARGLVFGDSGFKRVLREWLCIVAWENYIHDTFREKKTSPAQKRRRDLVLELSYHDWVSVSDIEELSGKIAKMYVAAGERMLQRDLNALAGMGLIERKHGKVKARKTIIQAFLPAGVLNSIK